MQSMRRKIIAAMACGTALSCGGSGSTDPFASGTGGSDSTGNPGSASLSSSTTGVADSSEGDPSAGPKLDILQPDLMPVFPPPSCEVVDGMDAVGECGTQAPANAFTPDVQWSWSGGAVIVTPLVANLTDDNGDGAIDLCDTPEVIVAAASGLGAKITLLDGATGIEQMQFPTTVSSSVTPALGDLDGDGVAEIVSAIGGPLPGPMAVVAFDNVGNVLWQTDAIWPQDQGGAVGIADFDADGSPEVYADGFILDANGTLLFQAPAQTGWFIAQRNTATVAADLDDDGDLELVLGQAAYHHDGTVVYNDTTIKPGYPQIANLDDDGDPEILINNDDGITVLEHDGTVKYKDQKPTGDVGLGAWFRPSTVHDFDGDGISDFAVSSAASYSVYDRDLSIQWSAAVQDGSGWAAGTAFDFLGAGHAEAMYADEANLFVFDQNGAPLLTVPRSSRTLVEYPVVADVDNDGSSEIVVVSSDDWDGNQTAPSVQVIRDADDRWIQSRRIWNQHAYHVTNVREDGTIPAVEPKSWQLLNTYRTNAQIENGSVCQPPAG